MSAPDRARAADHEPGLSPHSRRIDHPRLCGAACRSPGAARETVFIVCATCCDSISGTVHVVGAGLAGLSAAGRLRRAAVRSWSTRRPASPAAAAARTATPRWHDHRQRQHLLLSGNRAALDYLRSIGAEQRLTGPAHAEFSFADLASGRALDAAAERRADSRSGCSTQADACRTRDRSTICHWRGFCGRPPARRWAGDLLQGPAVERLVEPCSWPRSISMRRWARRGWRVR